MMWSIVVPVAVQPATRWAASLSLQGSGLSAENEGSGGGYLEKVGLGVGGPYREESARIGEDSHILRLHNSAS